MFLRVCVSGALLWLDRLWSWFIRCLRKISWFSLSFTWFLSSDFHKVSGLFVEFIRSASSLIDKLSNRTDSCFLDLLKITAFINWTPSIVLFFLPLLLRKFTTYRWYWLRNFTCVSIFMTYFQQCSLSWGVMKIARYKKIFLRAGLLRG